MNRIRLAVALALGWAASASADDWGEVAQISTTLGVQANRLCLGEASRGDIGCPSYAPYVSASTGRVGIGTTAPSATLHLSNAGTSDTSGEAHKLMFSAGSAPLFGFRMSSGNSYIMLDTAWSGVWSTPISIKRSLGYVGFGATDPSTSVHVSGTVRIANGGETCDANRAGALRWHAGAGQFQVCYGSGGWAMLSSAATSGSTVDRIVSGTSSVIASQDRSVTISTAGTQRMVVGENGYVGVGTVAPDRLLHLVGAQGYQIALQQNGSASASTIGADNNSFLRVKGFNGLALVVSSTNQERMRIEANTGNVGIGTTSPSKTLTVNGDADVSGTVKVAGTGAESCTMGTLGQIRLNPTSGKFEVCRQ